MILMGIYYIKIRTKLSCRFIRFVAYLSSMSLLLVMRDNMQSFILSSANRTSHPETYRLKTLAIVRSNR